MNVNTANEVNGKQLSRKQEIDWVELLRKVWTSRKLILKLCGIGAVIGLVVAFGTPKEYTAKIFIAPEGYSKSSASGMDALAAMAGIASSPSVNRDAIYPSLYTNIIHSTPFLIRLFNIEVRAQKDTAVITLARYIKERQKAPWWSIITSAPSRLVSRTMSLFSLSGDVPKEEKANTKNKIDPFQLTREEAGIASVIASKIEIEVDKEKRTITLFATMQDPLIAATIVDTVCIYLQTYIKEYRTSKARNILEYNEKLCKEAKVKYYKAQEKYAGYADINRNLVKLTSRAELARLRNDMDLAFSAYNQMEIQVQAAKARVEKVTPVYAVIQPVLIPLTPSKPRKTLILAGCILLSGAGSMIWVLFAKDFVRNIKRKESPVGK